MALGLAQLNWMSVEIPRVPPKPLLTPLTGGYRRTPVLQIGADVYCDTQNIVRALSEQGAADRLFATQIAAGDLILSDWIDQQLFPLAARVVITNSLESAPPEFVKDRGDLYFGANWSVDQLRADFSGVVMQLKAGLRFLDDSLTHRGVDDHCPLSYGDVAVAFVCWFLRGRWDLGPDTLALYPNLCRIESAVSALGHGSETAMEAESALQVAREASPHSPRGISVQTDLTLGQPITIRPFQPSSDPSVCGKLRYFDATRVSIDIDDPTVGDIAVHFPVLGYQISSR